MSPYWWLGIAAVMAVVEAVSLSFITIWFVVGALCAFAASFFGASLTVQIVVFLAVSLACVALLRPLALKHRKIGESHEATPVGQSAIVVERIDGDGRSGRVETPDHMTWAALSAGGAPIEVGTRVAVVGQRSVKLVVEPALGAIAAQGEVGRRVQDGAPPAEPAADATAAAAQGADRAQGFQ